MRSTGVDDVGAYHGNLVDDDQFQLFQQFAVGFGVFEKFVDASPLQTEVRVVGQQGVEGQFEEAVQGTASGIDGGYAGRCKHHVLFLCIRAEYFRKVDLPVPALPVRNTD